MNDVINIMRPLDQSIDIEYDEIHLWLLRDKEICAPSVTECYTHCLTQEEQIKSRRFHFDKHRRQYVATRTLVRSVLSIYRNSVLPIEWCFSKNIYGRPAIANADIDRPLYFSLSHTENMVVLAICRLENIGVDTEWIYRDTNIVKIAGSYFSPSEMRQLHLTPTSEKAGRFFDFWTLKEAYIKARSMGLSIPLDSFSFAISASGKINITFEEGNMGDPNNWLFWQSILYDEYRLAVALKTQSPLQKYRIQTREVSKNWFASEKNSFPVTHPSHTPY